MSGIKDGQFISGDIASFLMIGQSNMAGRGELSDVQPIDNFRCYMLRNGRFLRMREPINPDRPIFEGKFRSGVSLAASFADEYARDRESRVGLIPCADGGTTLDQWQPGEIIYDHAVCMTKLAMRTSRISGILWHQGESECLSEELLLAAKDKLANIIISLRRDIGAGDIPFIIGELSTDISFEWKVDCRPARLNEIFRELARELPGIAVVPSAGLTLKPDGIHFDSKSLREFGKRYYKAYVAVEQKRNG